MHVILFILLLAGAIIGPGIWVKRIMAKYSVPVDRYAETGEQTARKLLDAAGLQDVGLEVSEVGDHYDPTSKTVRLSPQNFEGRSLTAVTIAAHEVGHAVQDAQGFGPLRWRTRLVNWVGPIEKIGVAALMLSPVIIGITKVPAAGLLMIAGGMLTLGAGVMVHLMTLPTEFDASFGRAMPMLAEHRVLRKGDERHARKLLKAAALTYVSAALMSLLNVARWWAILRR
ncbi:MAG: zinc metallopeptidase [Gammaproteobacteria bacterium]|nr:MAG: zinc metallopeptidase [Gammaproteobacteria bacterium]